MNGGYTMVISVPGSLRPGSLITPENIRAEVYLPQYLIDELSALKPVIATLIQTFIETIGMEVSERWLRAAEDRWTLQGGQSITGQGEPVIFPKSPDNSCYYEFWGHPRGELEELITAARDAGSHTDQRTSESAVPDPEIARLTEELRRLNEENAHLRELSEKQAAEITALRAAEQRRAEEGKLPFSSGFL